MAYGESMKVDFAIIKLPVARIVARFCALELVIDGIFVIATNAMLQPSVWTSSLRGKLSMFIYKRAIKLKPLAKYKVTLFCDPDVSTPGVEKDTFFSPEIFVVCGD